MNLLNLMRHSVIVKHVLLLFLLIASILGLGFYFLYRSVHKLLLDDVQNEAILICRENVNQYDQAFTVYEEIAKIISETLADKPVEQWNTVLQFSIKNITLVHPEIYAIGAAAIPDSRNKDSGKLSLALYQEGKIELRYGKGYADQSWFADVVKSKKGIWTEPFHGQIIQEFISVYSCPIFRTMQDGSRKMVGVVCLDLKIDWLNRDIREITLENQGFVLLLSAQGQFLSSKFDEFIGKKYNNLPSIKQIPVPGKDLIDKIHSFVKSGNREGLVLRNPVTHKNMHFFFRQMKTTGWIFMVAFPEDAIFSSINCFQSFVLMQIAGVIAVLLLSAFLMIHKVSIPLHKISCFAEQIGKGNFSEPVPVVKGRSEISDLALTIDQMRYSLIQYILSVQKISALENERAKNRKLLLNTLPEHVIEEFNRTGKCTPEFSESATVFFSDIVGFTSRSSELPAPVVIEELNSIFSNFDRIFSAHHVERIKTIGDAYMAIAGLHEPKENHCERVLDAALEARRYLQERNAKEKLQWQIRIGIHTGPIAAGIVGVERYIYDVFGDAVNTAARMEQLSEPMKINVSETVQKIASKRHFAKRPAIEVKGKGFLQMYFLEDEEQEKNNI